MSVYKINRKTIRVTLPEEDYLYIERQIWKNQDTVRTVPGYVRRLVRHHIHSLRIEEEIQQSQRHLKSSKRSWRNTLPVTGMARMVPHKKPEARSKLTGSHFID